MVMSKQSAGLLLYKRDGKDLRVLLVHPGGPFWAKKDVGSWSIPKGEFVEGEDPQEAAKREFHEELGLTPPDGQTIDLGSAKQSSGKMIYIWAQDSDLDISKMHSNTFEIQWPPKSGQMQQFPEADKAAWLTLEQASVKIVKGQMPFLERLAEQHGRKIRSEPSDQQAALF